MMIEQHYDEEVLARFLGEPSEVTARDRHLDSCPLCKRTLQSIRDTAVLLKNPAVWERQPADAPKRDTLAFLRNVQATMAQEDQAAEVYASLLLAGPRETWASKLDAHPAWRTAGLVRKLIAATDRAIDLMPPDALEITRLARDVAEQLPASDQVIRLRGNACYEQGYALFYTGAFHEAEAALASAEAHFAGLPIADHEIGRLRLVRALVYRALGRVDDAMSFIGAAAAVFRDYGDGERCHAARLFMGAAHYSARRFREALAIHLEIVNEETIDPRWRAAALQNAAICHREVGEIDAAIDCFVKAISAFEAAGMMSLRAKARWTLARILVERQQYEPALVMFAELRAEFEELGMANDVALVALDIAELLLATGRNEGIAGACRQAIAYFEKMQLTSSEAALTAVTYLCEAAVAGSATPAMVSNLRNTFLSEQDRPRANPQTSEFLRKPGDPG